MDLLQEERRRRKKNLSSSLAAGSRYLCSAGLVAKQRPLFPNLTRESLMSCLPCNAGDGAGGRHALHFRSAVTEQRRKWQPAFGGSSKVLFWRQEAGVTIVEVMDAVSVGVLS